MTALPDWDLVSDGELASAAAVGDRRAFARIYERCADRLHDFCIGMVRDREAAADCVQDVFCTAAAQLPKLREPDKLRPWLYAIARNEALRALRQRGREQPADELPELVSGEAGPDTLAARSELASLVAEAAGGLSERDRAVLELTYRHGLDGSELAEALGVSPGNANKLVSRLRQTVEHSLGALLVARRARQNPNGCVQLGGILAGWDGRFSTLMRKRIARHIESCPTCDQERRRLINPVTLLGGAPVLIPAPDWLRQQTLSQIQLTAAGAHTIADSIGASSHGLTTTPRETTFPSSGNVVADDEMHVDDVRARRARLIFQAVLVTGALIIALGLILAWLHHRNTPIAPTAPPTPTSTGPPSASNPPPSSAPAPSTISAVPVSPGYAPSPVHPSTSAVPAPVPTAATPSPPPTSLPQQPAVPTTVALVPPVLPAPPSLPPVPIPSLPANPPPLPTIPLPPPTILLPPAERGPAIAVP